jgi:hypothetical protein
VKGLAASLAVVDRTGRPVTDLTAADFEIIDNGRPQEIVAFQRVDQIEITVR